MISMFIGNQLHTMTKTEADRLTPIGASTPDNPALVARFAVEAAHHEALMDNARRSWARHEIG